MATRPTLPAPGSVSPARTCAFAVLRRVFEQAAYADRALTAEAVGLEPRDRALATALAFGAVQRRATLDHVAEQLMDRSVRRLQPPVLAALRLGLLQILYMDGIAVHAAVNESVELAKAAGGRGGSGLVNAVLRRAIREGPELLAGLSDATPAQAAIQHSVPEWLAELWFTELGPEPARGLLAQINAPAEAGLRVNTLIATAEEVMAALPVSARSVPELPEALILQAPFDVHGSELWRRGAVMAQSRGSMLAGRALSPAPGARVLDLCAAPGAKATQLAALSGGGETITAVERNPGRARALRETFDRMQVTGANIEVGDAAQPRSEGPAFDAVLVDPPCSGLGTLQSRPDLRWRTSPERIEALSQLQARILRAGAQATAPGGALVYSVCTLSQTEGERVVGDFLADNSEFRAEDIGGLLPAAAGPYLLTRPDRDGTDGFFIARLRRAG